MYPADFACATSNVSPVSNEMIREMQAAQDAGDSLRNELAPTGDELEFMRLDSALREIEHGASFDVCDPLAFDLSGDFVSIEQAMASMSLRGWSRYCEHSSDHAVYRLNGHFADVRCTEPGGVRVELRRSLLGAGTLHHLSLARRHKHWSRAERSELAGLLAAERRTAAARREAERAVKIVEAV